MFFLILPGTIWAILILFIRVQEAVWRGPVGAFGFAAWSLLLLPTALICLIIAVVQAFRKKKFAVALLIGLGWNLLFLAAFWMFVYFIPK
jgi:hypothetical protein